MPLCSLRQAQGRLLQLFLAFPDNIARILRRAKDEAREAHAVVRWSRFLMSDFATLQKRRICGILYVSKDKDVVQIMGNG